MQKSYINVNVAVTYIKSSASVLVVGAYIITKTRQFKYIESFTTKNWKFSDKNCDFFVFLLKT